MPSRDSAALLLKKMKNEFFRVGVITSAHGIRGEVNVFPTTDDPGKFEDLKEVLLDKNGEKVPCAIEHVKYFKKMVILKLAGIDDRNTADLYRQKELFVSREDAVPLEEGQYYLADLIGLFRTREKSWASCMTFWKPGPMTSMLSETERKRTFCSRPRKNVFWPWTWTPRP